MIADLAWPFVALCALGMVGCMLRAFVPSKQYLSKIEVATGKLHVRLGALEEGAAGARADAKELAELKTRVSKLEMSLLTRRSG